VLPPRKGIVTKRYKPGSFALSLVACPDFRFLLLGLGQKHFPVPSFRVYLASQAKGPGQGSSNIGFTWRP
jgi:hypothetical protein